jgi:hypothetical protein
MHLESVAEAIRLDLSHCAHCNFRLSIYPRLLYQPGYVHNVVFKLNVVQHLVCIYLVTFIYCILTLTFIYCIFTLIN